MIISAYIVLFLMYGCAVTSFLCCAHFIKRIYIIPTGIIALLMNSFAHDFIQSSYVLHALYLVVGANSILMLVSDLLYFKPTKKQLTSE